MKSKKFHKVIKNGHIVKTSCLKYVEICFNMISNVNEAYFDIEK